MFGLFFKSTHKKITALKLTYVFDSSNKSQCLLSKKPPQLPCQLKITSTGWMHHLMMIGSSQKQNKRTPRSLNSNLFNQANDIKPPFGTFT